MAFDGVAGAKPETPDLRRRDINIVRRYHDKIDHSKHDRSYDSHSTDGLNSKFTLLNNSRFGSRLRDRINCPEICPTFV